MRAQEYPEISLYVLRVSAPYSATTREAACCFYDVCGTGLRRNGTKCRQGQLEKWNFLGTPSLCAPSEANKERKGWISCPGLVPGRRAGLRSQSCEVKNICRCFQCIYFLPCILSDSHAHTTHKTRNQMVLDYKKWEDEERRICIL